MIRHRAPFGLVGRARESGLVEGLLQDVREGDSRVLVIRGEPGIGKSALLEQAIASASGYQVTRAAGVQLEMELPFAGLHQLCAPLLDRVGLLPGPQRDAISTVFGLAEGSPPDRFLVGLALLSLLSEASGQAPLLCAIDDAQWLDLESVHALAFAARRLLADRVCMLFATREAREDLRGLPEMVVDGLSDAAARSLLALVLRVPLDERVRERIIAEAQGNPLALLEWPRGLNAAEPAGGFGLPALPMAGQIEESFRRRLDELPPATQRLLTVAAAEPTGDASTVWRAAARLGAGGHDAAPAEEAGLIELGATLRFRHPTVRSAAYAAAAMDDRRAAHRALADVTDANTDLDRRAWHLALAAEGPDEKVAAELERCAGRAQARGGLPAAAALLERSVSLTLDPAERARRTLGAASAHLEGGSFDRGATLLTSMDTTVLDEMGLARLDLLRARHAYVAGALRDAPSLLLRAAKRLEPLDVASASATYLAAMGAAVVAGNFAHGVSVTDVARAATAWPTSDAPPPPEALTRALARATVEGPAAAAPALRGALELAGGGASGREALPWLGFLESAATVLWDSPTLHRISVERVTAAREVGALWVLAWALNTLTHVLILEGELEGAESLVAETIQIVEATGSNQVPWGGVLLAGWRGDGDSRRAIDDLIPRATARGDALALKDAQWASAILGNGMGRYDEALVIAKEADRQPWEWGSQLYFHELIEAAVRTGDIAEAVAAVERLGDMVKASGSDWGLGIHARCRALLSAGGLAEELYTEAIERLEHTAIRPEAARAHLLYGEWLRREYRRVDARYHLRTAYERLSAMGIHAFAERARRELGATGETVRKRTVGTRRELTPQETQVAKLARDGLSNPEIGARLFISARTVQYHLSKVFTTLGITSRAQLEHALQ